MSPFVRNILAVLLGVVAGSLLNMSLVMLGPVLVPPPPGTNLTTAEGLKAAMPLMQPIHFLFPFLAHALGTMGGSWVAARIAASNPRRASLLVGALFLAGGISMVRMVASPLWFTLCDLILAYLPMAWLGLYLSGRHQTKIGPKKF